MPDNEPKVAVVIVNWNRKDLLLEAIGSCYAADYSNLTMILVDNGSEDGSIAAVKDAYPETVIIANKDNLGFARGSNQGLEKAIDMDMDYILFLNNDATVETNAIQQLVDLLETHTKAAAAAPYIFYHNRQGLIWYGGGIVAFWRGLIAHRHIRRKFNPQKHKQRETDYLTGCVFMIKADVLRNVGGFDLSLGMYSEDVDLSLRIRHAGWELWVTPDARSFHRVSASTGGELSPFKAFHRGRSNALLVRRWARWWEYPTLILGGLLGVGIITLRLIFSGRILTVFALIGGVFSGFLDLGIPRRFQLKQVEA